MSYNCFRLLISTGIKLISLNFIKELISVNVRQFYQKALIHS